MHLHTFNWPAWSALSADDIEAFELPDEVRAVAIAADHDANSRGYHAALTACERWQAEGRSVEIFMPPNIGDDFNSILMSKGK